MKAIYLLLSTLSLALALDGLTKVWAERSLSLYQPVPVVGQFFRFTLGHNTGVAFGMFAGAEPWPAIITGIIIAGLIIWFTRALWQGHFRPLAGLPIGLLLGGALANFMDRLPDSRVTDFLDVGLGATRWPTFNVADSLIMIGLAWLILLGSHNAQPEKETTMLDDSPID